MDVTTAAGIADDVFAQARELASVPGIAYGLVHDGELVHVGGRGAATVVTVRMNRSGSGTAIVPVASDGTIAFTTSTGATDLAVDITGYFLAGDQPNVTVATPAGRHAGATKG